jgi:very-short-patch-repair endonuclease
MSGHGCPSCSGNRKLSSDEFIKSATKVHSKDYIYDYIDYKNMHSKVKIICPMHGEFNQLPLHHIKGVGCPKCNQSKGEKLIEMYLNNNQINFIPQKKFDDCKHINHLIFDFYLPDYNTCIEFNGIQHYFVVDIFGGKESLEINKKRDKIKEEYCKSKGIKLIVIKQDKKHINIKDVQVQIENIKKIIT